MLLLILGLRLGRAFWLALRIFQRAAWEGDAAVFSSARGVCRLQVRIARVAFTEPCACRAQRALAEACACSSQCPEFQRPSEVASFTHTSTSGRKVRGVSGYAARARGSRRLLGLVTVGALLGLSWATAVSGPKDRLGPKRRARSAPTSDESHAQSRPSMRACVQTPSSPKSASPAQRWHRWHPYCRV